MLQNIGIPGLLLIAVVVLVLFGKGKVSSLMGEVGRGITAFKRGVNEGAAEIEREKTEASTLEGQGTDSQAADAKAGVARPVPGADAQNVTPPSDRG